MPSLLQLQSRIALRQRSLALRPDTPARWGRFTAPEMLSHIIQSLRVMAGEVDMPAEPTSWLVCHAPVKHLLIYILPFPKGLPTSPVLLERPVTAPQSSSDSVWRDELQVFAELLESIGARPTTHTWPRHAAFGPLTGREWGVLQFRHIDHHFRQFGL